jgi:hypothetical protein
LGALPLISCVTAHAQRTFFQDHVTSIDQHSALAGGVTPGDSPGFPVVISQPGSYKLTGNLTVPDANTTAIQISADFVTLDLDGFSIIGPITCTGGPVTCPAPGTGIGVQAIGNDATGPRGVRILNGSVHGMGLVGIQVPDATSVVEKIIAHNNAGGGIVAGQVKDSTANQNGSFGILAFTVRDSAASENTEDGIILNSGGGIASGNVSSVNGGYGISAPYATISGNSVFLNKLFGIAAQCPSNIVGNTVVSSDGSNFQTLGTDCVLVNNATRQ